MGTPTPKGAHVEAGLSRMARVLGLHQECPRVVKLVMKFHHVSQGGNQEKFRDGANVWASPCEFRW